MLSKNEMPTKPFINRREFEEITGLSRTQARTIFNKLRDIAINKLKPMGLILPSNDVLPTKIIQSHLDAYGIGIIQLKEITQPDKEEKVKDGKTN